MTTAEMNEIKDFSYRSLICAVFIHTINRMPSNEYKTAGTLAGKILSDFAKESGIDIYSLAVAEIDTLRKQ